MPTLVLVSRADPASVTIRDALLATGGWEETGAFRGLPVRRRGAFAMAEVEPLHLECDHLDRELREAGLAFDAILFASKHRAESGKPALTVHPIGNPRRADAGGLPGRLVPTDPVRMGRVLRALAREAKGLRHEATFEATHHGPYLETPAAFVEIGTDERAWSDPDLGARVARAILAAETPEAGDAAPALVMLGGSHYAPRATDLVRRGRALFGHILPGHALDGGVEERVLLDAIRLTPGCRGYYADPRLMQASAHPATAVFGALELGWWRDEDLA